VVELFLEEAATQLDASNNVFALSFNTNLVLYYQAAFLGGVDVSQLLDGKNGGHLRWFRQKVDVPSAKPAITSSATRPSLSPKFALDGSGGLQMSVTGGATTTVIEASTNLADWVPIWTNPPNFTSFTYTNFDYTNFLQRYYRAVNRP
jgi:hypothetical protein